MAAPVAALNVLRRLPPIAWVLLLGALLRLLNLASATGNPLTYSPGPDEAFYLAFAAQVAQHGWAIPVEFAFMDPLYGYLAGALFALTGDNVFALYLAQVGVDLLTIWLLYRCGVALGSARAGLVAALLHALCATAIFHTVTVLKEIWVLVFMAGWMLLTLRAMSSARRRDWLALGLLCAVGTGLRGNLLLLGLLTLPALWLVCRRQPSPRHLRGPALAFVAGFVLPLCLLATFNAQRSLGWTPLPYNGGIVLHHLYNADNPAARSIYPAFVEYRHPQAIWNAYRREAERQLGQPLAAPQVEAFWRARALDYLRQRPAQAWRNGWRKFGEFLAWPEVPNNRVFMQERDFSPVLRHLPAPFGWLLALGVPGLVLLAAGRRGGWILGLPLLVTLFTVMVFFAESRFRLPALPALALGAGVLIDHAIGWLAARRWRPLGWSALAVGLLGAISLQQARGMVLPGIDPARLAWGHLRMGEVERAESLARERVEAGTRNAGLWELLAFVAVERDADHAAAITSLRRALEIAPDSHVARYNLARSLAAIGDLPAARREIDRAVEQDRQPEYLALQQRLRSPDCAAESPGGDCADADRDDRD